MGNKGAFITLTGGKLEPQYTTYEGSPLFLDLVFSLIFLYISLYFREILYLWYFCVRELNVFTNFSCGPPKCEADGLCELPAQPLWIVNTYLSLLGGTSVNCWNQQIMKDILHCFKTPTRLQRFAKSILNTKMGQLGIFWTDCAFLCWRVLKYLFLRPPLLAE